MANEGGIVESVDYNAMIDALANIVMQYVYDIESHMDMCAALKLVMDSLIDSLCELCDVTHNEVLEDIEDALSGVSGRFVVDYGGSLQ